MFEKRLRYGMLFRLAMLCGLSLSLSIPVTEAAGYTGPGIALRLLGTMIFLALFTVHYIYPVVILLIPLGLLTAGALYLYDAALFIDLFARYILAPPTAASLLPPFAMVAGITLALSTLVFRCKCGLPLLFIVGAAAFTALWYFFVDVAYPAAVCYSLCWLMLLSYGRGSGYWCDAGSSLRGVRGQDGGRVKEAEAQVYFQAQAHLQAQVREEAQVQAELEVRRCWLGYTFTLLALTLLFTLLTPREIAPLPWRSLQAWAYENITLMSMMRGSAESQFHGEGGPFYFYVFDAQSRDHLGGPLRLDETVLLEVRGAAGGSYLRGGVQEFYTGSGWSTNAGSFPFDEADDIPEALRGVLIEEELIIRHKIIKTSTVFSMPYPVSVTGLSGSLKRDKNGALAMAQPIPLGEQYTVRGMSFPGSFDYALLEESEDEIIICGCYLTLPAGLPQRVWNVALEVAGDEEGSYDKMQALTAHLRQNYRYEVEMPHVSADRDFVDFFLFQAGEGYCTYFATALAVMGRAVGVPTRFVSGFVLPHDENGHGFRQVPGINAHAWVEAYIPGAAWLPFEATPGFAAVTAVPDPAFTAPASVAEERDSAHDAPDYYRDMLDLHADYPYYSGDAGKDDPAAAFLASLPVLMGGLLAALLVSIIILTVYRAQRLKALMRELSAVSPRLRAIAYYRITLSLLDRMALGKYPGETPREYGRRIIRHVHSYRHNFRDLSEGINLALYSKKEVSPKLAAEAEHFYRHIFERYLGQVGKAAALTEILLQGRHFKRFHISRPDLPPGR